MQTKDKPVWNTGLINNGKLEQVYEFAVVRHGHWINHFDDLFPMESTVECSICGEKEWMMTIINHNYCPNCGAKMDEVRNE